MDSATKAIEQLRSQSISAADKIAQAKAKARPRYVALLHSKTASPAEVKELLELVETLGLSHEQVAADKAAVDRAYALKADCESFNGLRDARRQVAELQGKLQPVVIQSVQRLQRQYNQIVELGEALRSKGENASRADQELRKHLQAHGNLFPTAIEPDRQPTRSARELEPMIGEWMDGFAKVIDAPLSSLDVDDNPKDAAAGRGRAAGERTGNAA